MCCIYCDLVETPNATDHLWVSSQFAQSKPHFSYQCKSPCIWWPALKQNDSLKVKNALLMSAYYVTKGSESNLFRIGLSCPWFRKELKIPESNLAQGRPANVMQFTWVRNCQGWPKLPQQRRVCTHRREKSKVFLRASILFRFSTSI
jgi:hypothetical protein